MLEEVEPVVNNDQPSASYESTSHIHGNTSPIPSTSTDVQLHCNSLNETTPVKAATCSIRPLPKKVTPSKYLQEISPLPSLPKEKKKRKQTSEVLTSPESIEKAKKRQLALAEKKKEQLRKKEEKAAKQKKKKKLEKKEQKKRDKEKSKQRSLSLVFLQLTQMTTPVLFQCKIVPTAT